MPGPTARIVATLAPDVRPVWTPPLNRTQGSQPSTYRFPDYQVAGEADTTVYLLHGAYGSKDYFRAEIETLVKAGFRVVAWDAPGYGISPLPAGGLRIEGLAEAAARLIERTGSKTNIIMGHSMGGITAPLVTRLAADKVHG